LRGGPGKAELLLGLAQMARTLSISQSPDDKIVFRVLWLIRRARFKAVEIAIAIANPSINSSSLPLAPRSTAHYKKSTKKSYTILFYKLKKTTLFKRHFFDLFNLLFLLATNF
jgi:hypothetical protein